MQNDKNRTYIYLSNLNPNTIVVSKTKITTNAHNIYEHYVVDFFNEQSDLNLTSLNVTFCGLVRHMSFGSAKARWADYATGKAIVTGEGLMGDMACWPLRVDSGGMASSSTLASCQFGTFHSVMFCVINGLVFRRKN